MCVMVVVVVVVCVYVCMEWVVFIVIAWDEASILIAVHFSMKNIYQLICDAEQRRRGPITFVVYWRFRDIGRVSPWC